MPESTADQISESRDILDILEKAAPVAAHLGLGAAGIATEVLAVVDLALAFAYIYVKYPSARPVINDAGIRATLTLTIGFPITQSDAREIMRYLRARGLVKNGRLTNRARHAFAAAA